ncbi:demethylmenaquinone methyltransferase / 2-methoxy-6-polyprenyl-1,4-benzoquinol methylase [Natronincola peptidivorans]|uniref:Demethylmenaquinone methyltransferase / 2-methoxy-6-polyprenyl-1,4-benzoquinol methylase n=1 Tax=Natronincola peptidivorans TaxID=426128 RepID=A0A1I0GZR8_9FIRM|nr:class I SAM-dependent methyltransferase [Natronincola peptidivorans]SET76018.1 demethylmenaquinone methyltransferase / 2-methoxy-6-polyprenyl-1,4-benzoquinol methylase [Natronincola peptidivorans]
MKSFDRVYRHYDGFMKLFKLYKVEEIMNALELQGNEMVVDIGGGTGYLAKNLSNSCKKIYVLDQSEKMLSLVEENEKVEAVVGDGMATGFEDSSMDVVILSDVLHHVKEQQEILLEISRILKPKGKLLILDFNKNHFKTKILHCFEHVLFGGVFYRTACEVKDLIKEKFDLMKEIDKKYYFIIVGEKNDQ